MRGRRGTGIVGVYKRKKAFLFCLEIRVSFFFSSVLLYDR